MLIVDPVERSVQWYDRGPESMKRVDRSDVLDLTAAEFAALIDWPELGRA